MIIKKKLTLSVTILNDQAPMSHDIKKKTIKELNEYKKLKYF